MVAAKRLILYIGVPLVALLLVVGTAVGLIFYYTDPEAAAANSRKKLVIDHDGGADDAFAITMSLLNEKYFCGPNVVALTATFGNVNISQAVINSDRILSLVDRQDVPIYKGASKAVIGGIESDNFYGYDGLGDDGYMAAGPIDYEDQYAAVALLELSKKYEGDLIIIAVGPVTNLALAARLDPDFIGRLHQLYVGGGHIYSEAHPKPEFNAHVDPEAYRIVADSATPDKVTFVPFSQVYDTLNVSQTWREDVLGQIPTPTMRALNGFERISSQSYTAWTQLDPAVTAVALHDIADEYRNSNFSILLEGEKRAINTNDFSSEHPNARLMYAANKDRYKKFLIDIYSAELSP
ncbi:probable uridine nucleosidase 2 isoform X1 [Helicoverpa zea]|uniref:probable uridine nucleosidase 2 isoform X1 n=1 Tax=Helicoverpa zea TaxID=7113 RepID=UPI001F59D031|nr:probable uridine nucleosidase 2 isoform X1 [Helicoverpa zea]XP_047036169.1 probable uridine nucleosidase 2 isoform X1 [Helicoverpa zea]XP_047036176.1 probable uridine nucleosidase 2 isoform X1 [Helicoverpa zea]XP_047036184.1 probable uridine nucleosidase 2 isoform X1 [Helicoverpa zea]XP_047036193.1 probable uridine nucleosidase 2 isoform X1 [Helicoverpa zea]XP_047036201.1 probable uridine nucleosidase 2 isoform X1 [Helicoverpa zea]XP_047036209.1 probable uridine nucleosidase 2 isoform X1 [